MNLQQGQLFGNEGWSYCIKITACYAMGDIHPSERGFKKDSQYSRALNEVVKAGDALIGTITEKQKEQFEN